MTQEQPPPSRPPAGTIANRLAEGLEAVVDEVVADMAAPTGHALARPPDGLARHGFLRPVAASGQLLDDLAVAVTRVEVHAGVDARGILAQDSLGLADLFEERVPVGGLEGAQAPDAGGDASDRPVYPPRVPPPGARWRRRPPGTRAGRCGGARAAPRPPPSRAGARSGTRRRGARSSPPRRGARRPSRSPEPARRSRGARGAHRRRCAGAGARRRAGTPRERAGWPARRCSSCRAATPRPGDPRPGRLRRAGGTRHRGLAAGRAADRRGEGRRRTPLLALAASRRMRSRASPSLTTRIGQEGRPGLSAPDGSAPPLRLASARARTRDPGAR